MVESNETPAAPRSVDTSLINLAQLRGLSGLQALAYLEGEEARTLNRLLDVRALRNSILPICRLPNEILAEIILLAANSLPRNTTWITSTHVCHLWREVALNHTALWRSIDCKNMERAKVFLRRSGGSMVDVQLVFPIAKSLRHEHADSFSKQHVVEFVDFLRGASRRISKLEVELCSKTAAHFLPLLNFSFPNIKSFRTSLSFGQWGSPHLDASSRVIEADISPSLEELSLSYISIPWQTSIFRNLRSLTLCCQAIGASKSGVPAMDVFLSFIEPFAAKLESFHLIEAGSTPAPGAVQYLDPVRTVSLPALKKLSIAATITAPENMARLLAHFVIPEATFIMLEATLTESGSGLFSILPRTLGGLKSLGIIDELVFDSERACGELAIRGRVSHHSNSDRLLITLLCDDYDFDFDEMVIEMFGSLEDVFSQRISTFTYNGDLTDSGITTQHWTEFFSHFSNIITLNVHSHDALDPDLPAPIWAALEQVDTSTSHATSDPPMLCSNLRRLSVKSIEPPVTIPGRRWDWKLLECLHTRFRHSVPSKLEKLTLVGDGPEQNSKKLLQEMGVEWPAASKLVDEIEVVQPKLVGEEW